MPSIGCEILNSYISSMDNVNCEVIYWNHLFQQKTFNEETLFQSEEDFAQILPFLAILNEDNSEVKNRILLKMQGISPGFKSLGKHYYEDKLSKQISKIQMIIDTELDRLLSITGPLLFGVSAKFDSWIPGVVVASEVKKRRPDAICVIGGVEEKNALSVLFQKYEIFDFAIWGEGEIPLSLLIRSIQQKDENYQKIPRLLSRAFGSDQILLPQESEKTDSFLDLSCYPNIDYSVYFKYAKEISGINERDIQLPVETSRGCRWNKCNFCALNWGNLYRTLILDNVVDQIRKYYLKHNVVRFFFVDNDVVGKNIELFEEFLDKLINLSDELEVEFDFHADILHLNFNSKIIKKLSLAGFRSVQIGYEGVSDSMLKKLNKSTTFADNILFVKFGQKYDIEVTITGLIIGIPNECESDVYESVNNLHFLRFFLGKKKKELEHPFSQLVLFHETRFWKMISQSEREKYNINSLNDYFPSDFTNNEYVRYSLFGQWIVTPLMRKWNAFKEISDYYQDNEFKYYLIKDSEVIKYAEYRADLKVQSLTFDQPEYWDVLKFANDEVVSLNKLQRKINEKYSDIDHSRLIEIIEELESSYLLYSSTDHSKMVSIIDTERF
jgi:radical SAM superfamily enzyme YgiQ (UPF0313 family)